MTRTATARLNSCSGISRVLRLVLAASCGIGLAHAACDASSTPCTISATGNFQAFTVSATGTYHIVVNGAQGGNNTSPFINASGGMGAQASGDFVLTAGQTYTVAVGVQGVSSSTSGANGIGGGGGSFLVDPGGNPLIVAGGGGGGAAGPGGNSSNGSPGQATTGGSASGSGHPGGTGGNGGSGGALYVGIYPGAGGGGGLNTNGLAGQAGQGTAGGGGASYLNGLTAGSAGGSGGGFGTAGGFGGGGGGANGGGGGGGYSGGGGDEINGGGGGGSFVASSVIGAPTITAGQNSGDGSISIKGNGLITVMPLTRISATGGFQIFTVSATGTYHIVVDGAQGGNNTSPFINASGGLGAQASGDFVLTAGQTYTVAVGVQGVSSSTSGANGIGGGGGSFLVDPGGNPLIVAGGGGGGAAGPGGNSSNGSPGQATTGGSASGSGNPGGTGGNGGSGGALYVGIYPGAGGGGGLNTNGLAGQAGQGTAGGGGGSYLNGLTAGSAGGSGGGFGTAGGFGGGGGGANGGGGGGGYSGGGGDEINGGGGGGSFVANSVVGTPTITAGLNRGNGSVSISGNGLITVTPIIPPTISKAFGTATIPLGGTTALTFTVTNPNATVALAGVAFSDALPAGLSLIATPATNTCGGTLTATAGSTSVSLASGTVSAAGSCQIVVGVTGTTAGVMNNTTGPITSMNGGAGRTSNTATLTVLAPPSISKAFGAQTILLGGTTTLTFTVTNPNTTAALAGVAFSDALPTGLIVAGTAATNTCGGSLTANPGSTSVSLANGTVGVAGSCQITVGVTGTVAGVMNNITGAITSMNGGPGRTSNTATLIVLAPLSISKAFGAPTIPPNATTTLTFTITNSNSTTAANGATFTDTLPAGLVVATPNGLTTSCGGTVTAVAGSGTINLTAGSIPANGTCSIGVNILATATGIMNNATGAVSSSNTGTGNIATATLIVAAPPALTKAFSAVAIPGGNAALTFTLTNPNSNVTLTGVSFSDTLPAGLEISTPNGLTGSCDGGTIGAPAGNNLITLGGASLGSGASCTFSVNVTSNGSAVGSLTNITSAVTSNEAIPGTPASAVIFIGQPFQVNYAANLNFGESYIDIGNAGTSGAPLMGPGFGGASGNICVNVYAFDPSEELISCCSCLVTPGQTFNLGVTADLTSKTLTGVIPSSVTIKLLSTLAGGTGTGTSCNNSAATAAEALANGATAFRTTLHATPVSGSYATTETQFTPATLSAAEQASITGRCASIMGNASGFGICSSCKAGALGGSKL